MQVREHKIPFIIVIILMLRAAFQGTAQVNDKCRCEYSIVWTANGPECISQE
jgi:hypothetical protein